MSGSCAILTAVADDDTTLALHVVPGSSLLHTRECPHLTVARLAVLEPATPDEIATMNVCSSCRAILDGGRRRTFATVDAALEAFQAPVENRPLIRELVAGLPQEYVWMPAGGSYVGISAELGAEAAAYINKGFVDVHAAEGEYQRAWLPTNGAGGSRGRSSQHGDRPVKVCPTCQTALPATGRCDTCD
jgi:hypothetical protein